MFCEYSVLHEARGMRRVSPSMARVLAREALRAIRNAGKGWSTIRLAGEVFGVPVIVSPDAVLVEDGRPTAVLRARVRGSLRLYPGDWAPLYLAGAVIESLIGGAEASLKLVAVVARDHALLAQALAAVRRRVAPARGEGWIVATRIYTSEEAERLIRRPLEVIAGVKPPRPPPPGRCARCRWRQSCPWSAAHI